MTPYDAWRTNVDETNEEAWEDATEVVAAEQSFDRKVEIVNTLALADDVLTWLSHAVEVPQHHIHSFRDLIKLSASLRKEVETEMKTYRDERD